jgi:hypothetical protein
VKIMPRHQIHDVETASVADLGPPTVDGRASWSARLSARLFAGHYDRQIEGGTSPVLGGPLAVHGARLVSARERDDLACALRRILEDADATRGIPTAHVPVHSASVHHAAEAIEAVYDRLSDPFPVRVRGMARLRILLSDGCGPLYRPGRGTLTAALRGVLATL